MLPDVEARHYRAVGSRLQPIHASPDPTRAWCSPTRRDITIDATIDAPRTPAMMASDRPIRNLPPPAVEPHHLQTHEDQDHGEAVAQQVEALHRIAEQEVQRSQAEDREHVGAEHDEGLACEREDGRHRIQREHNVGGLQAA
jgi:hypothetical protein